MTTDETIDSLFRQGMRMGWKGFGKKFIEKAEQEKDEIYNWDDDEYENGMKAGYQYCIEIAEELLHEKHKNDRN